MKHYYPKLVQKWEIQSKFEEDKDFEYGVNAAKLSHLLNSANPHEEEEIKRLNLPKVPKPNLIVLVGESGIGKTASICAYAKILRSERHPVIFYSFGKPETKDDISLDTFLKKVFGSDDIKKVCEFLKKAYYSKGITPTLILDNIHYCQYDDCHLASHILTTINQQLYQFLRLNIIMLSSVNNFAYKMETGSFIFQIFAFY